MTDDRSYTSPALTAEEAALLEQFQQHYGEAWREALRQCQQRDYCPPAFIHQGNVLRGLIARMGADGIDALVALKRFVLQLEVRCVQRVRIGLSARTGQEAMALARRHYETHQLSLEASEPYLLADETEADPQHALGVEIVLEQAHSEPWPARSLALLQEQRRRHTVRAAMRLVETLNMPMASTERVEAVRRALREALDE